MSKETFSQKLVDDMADRIGSISAGNLQYGLHLDDTFELALCLAYMSLSKEKIIYKNMDIDPRDHLGRLNKRVATKDIDALFSSKYDGMISYADDSDNTWRLDAIRDSIAHDAADIDEDNRKVIINNRQTDRHIIAEIPFEWFSDYIKTDIVRQRITNNYCFRNYYYNNYCNHYSPKFPFSPTMSVYTQIFYKVEIIGEDIQIDYMNDYISKLMKKYSEEIISEEEKENTVVDNMGAFAKHYNNDYAISFIKAKEKLVNELKKTFPNAKIEVSIEDDRRKSYKRVNKRLKGKYQNYDELFSDMNRMIYNNVPGMLTTISDIYMYLDQCRNLGKEPTNEEIQKEVLEIITKRDNNHDKHSVQETINRLCLVLTQIYGLAAFVLNNDNIKDSEYLKYLGKLFNSRTNNIDEFNREFGVFRQKIRGRLNAEFRYNDILKKLENPSLKEESRIKLEKLISEYETDLKQARFDLRRMEKEHNEKLFDDEYKNQNEYCKQKGEMNRLIDILFYTIKQYGITYDKTGKVIEKYITMAYEKKFELEKEYKFIQASPDETLRIFRNCFAHNDRIYLSNYYDVWRSNVRLTDKDNDGKITGIANCQLGHLIDAIRCSAYCNINEYTDTIEEGKVLIKS